MLITQDAVFKFDPVTKEMYLAGLHPGVTVKQVKSEVPWDLKVANNLELTELPTEEALKLIRRYAPEISMGRKLQLEALVNQVFRVLARSQGK